jgi:predicted transcriptional regulator
MYGKPTSGVDRGVLLELTAKIVSAYAAQTKVSASELLETIGAVSRALSRAGGPAPEPEKKEPVMAMPIKKTVTPDFIICLEDGKKLKMLKRHLMRAYNMTPAQYRAKWNLPSDYPMVAPNYARTRSELAKRIGLGKIAPLAASPSEPTASVDKDGEQE